MQLLTCHYDVFSQFVCLKKVMSRRTLFYFNAAFGYNWAKVSGTLLEDLSTFYFLPVTCNLRNGTLFK